MPGITGAPGGSKQLENPPPPPVPRPPVPWRPAPENPRATTENRIRPPTRVVASGNHKRTLRVGVCWHPRRSPQPRTGLFCRIAAWLFSRHSSLGAPEGMSGSLHDFKTTPGSGASTISPHPIVTQAKNPKITRHVLLPDSPPLATATTNRGRGRWGVRLATADRAAGRQQLARQYGFR